MPDLRWRVGSMRRGGTVGRLVRRTSMTSCRGPISVSDGGPGRATAYGARSPFVASWRASASGPCVAWMRMASRCSLWLHVTYGDWRDKHRMGQSRRRSSKGSALRRDALSVVSPRQRGRPSVLHAVRHRIGHGVSLLRRPDRGRRELLRRPRRGADDRRADDDPLAGAAPRREHPPGESRGGGRRPIAGVGSHEHSPRRCPPA